MPEPQEMIEKIRGSLEQSRRGHPFRWLGMFPDTKFKLYLERLNEILQLKLRAGQLSQADVDAIWGGMAQTISGDWPVISKWLTIKQDDRYRTDKEWLAKFDEEMTNIGFDTPFWDDTGGDEFQFRESLMPLQRVAYKAESERGSYLPRLRNALNALKARGEITEEGAQAATYEAEKAIGMGVSEKDLPYMPLVEGWEEFKKSEVKRLEGEARELKTGDWRQQAERLYQRQISESQQEAARGILERRGALRQQASEFEESRQDVIGQLGGPVDWIRRWQAQHVLSPLAGRTVSPYGYLSEEIMERGMPQPEIPSVVGRFAPGVTSTFEGFMRRPQYEQAVRAPLTKGAIVQPSPQAFSRMLPSERQQLRGYAEYAGSNWEDLVEKTRRLLPTPTPGSRWRPAWQR